jgi:hypothetical protein
LLYRQLAFIFQHKIGAVSDEAHKYYKVQLAEAMEPLLGPVTDEYFRALGGAPDNWQQVANDANVVPLIMALKSADKAFADDNKFVDKYLSLRQNPRRFKPGAFDVIDNFRGSAALAKFDVFAKAHHLRNIWKLDPVLMQELNRKYGPVDWREPNKNLPLDWRHPDTHAIYWAVKGLRVAGKKGVETPGESQYSLDEVNTDRIVYHSLQSLFRGGRIYIWEEPAAVSSQASSEPPRERRKEIYLRPDLRMFEPYNRHVLTVIEKYVDPNEEELASHQIGHRNMLKNALLSFYQSGHKRQAQKIYDQLRRQYPEDEFKVPLAVFARERFIEELKGLHIFNATELVQMLLREGYFLYAIRDDDGAFGRESLAKEVHDYYMSEWEEQHRIDLPAFALLRYLALRDFLDDRQYPVSLRRGLLARIKIERPKLYEELMKQEEKLRSQSQQGQT